GKEVEDSCDPAECRMVVVLAAHDFDICISRGFVVLENVRWQRSWISVPSPVRRKRGSEVLYVVEEGAHRRRPDLIRISAGPDPLPGVRSRGRIPLPGFQVPAVEHVGNGGDRAALQNVDSR